MLFGYLDPGSGSMILSAIVGALGAIALFFKLFWRRIVSLLSFKKNVEERQPSDDVA